MAGEPPTEATVTSREEATDRSTRTVVASTFRPILPLVVAQASGALGRAGIDVSVRTPASSDAQLSQLLGGEIDVAHTALDNIVAWSARGPVRVVGVLDLGVAHELVARDAIARIQDLRGKVIGVDSPHSGFVVLLQAALEDSGLDRDSYSLAPTGGLGRRADALMAGEMDACLLAGADLTRAAGAGFHRLLAIRDHFPDYPALALVARAPIEGERRATLTRYLGVLTEAVCGSFDDSQAVARALGTDEPAAGAWLAGERARITGVVVDAEGARRAIAGSLTATGRLSDGDSADSFLDILQVEADATQQVKPVKTGTAPTYTVSTTREGTR